MRMLGRTVSVLGLACLVQVPAALAQTTGFETFKWYFGAQAGVTTFETQTQTRGGIFTAGGHMLITAKRTGLLLTVEEGFKRNQTSAYADATAAGGVRQVTFNDLRRYSATLLAFPFRTIAQPYLGIGVGWMQTVKEYPSGTTPATAGAAQSLAERAGSYGFATFVGGVQTRVDRFVLFGQAELMTSPSAGKLLVGSALAFTGGLRISLGSSREGVSGAGKGSD